VRPHQNPDLRAVTLSFKRLGQAPGDATADQLERAAELADRFSAGEARVTHEQNLLLPWVRCDQCPSCGAKPAAGPGQAQHRPADRHDRLPRRRLLRPGQCPLAADRRGHAGRYQDLDELHDLGEIDLHISGCINSCGHHHSGHIGILGVDKDGQEWYQVTLGGSDGTRLSGEAVPGKVIGPSFAANEMVDVIEA
jgi:sulfite reductase (NADPH) hemoprotein beta-component